MHSRLSGCDTAKRRAREAISAIQNLAEQDWKLTIELLWEARQRFDRETISTIHLQLLFLCSICTKYILSVDFCDRLMPGWYRGWGSDPHLLPHKVSLDEITSTCQFYLPPCLSLTIYTKNAQNLRPLVTLAYFPDFHSER